MMKKLVPLLIAALVLPVPLVAHAQGNEQGRVRRDMRAGNVRPLREIEDRILPTMVGSEYLGPEYDPVAMAYRFKFIKNGRVTFVDVDARSGEVINQR
jgi:hypothetical protein